MDADVIGLSPGSIAREGGMGINATDRKREPPLNRSFADFAWSARPQDRAHNPDVMPRSGDAPCDVTSYYGRQWR